MVGNNPNYAPLDLMRCFLKLTEQRKSRQQLVKDLELGEGTIKSLLNLLKEKSLISSDKKGHRLSAKGVGIMKKIKSSISIPKQIVYRDFYSGLKKSGLQIRKTSDTSASFAKSPSSFFTSSVRDAAIRVGAEAAFVLYYDTGSLKMAKDDRYSFEEIARQFELKNSDIVVVGFASTYRKAELAVLAQAMYICPQLVSIAAGMFDIELNI